MDFQATNLTNTTPVPNNSSEVTGYPVASLLFFLCGIIIVICNITSFVLYMRFAQKNVYGILVMSLCNGNSLIGLSVCLATSHLIFIRMPYLCVVSLFTSSWGIIYNISITFWISFNQFCIVKNLHYKDSLLEKRRYFIIALTAVGVTLYLILLFLTIQDNDSNRCQSVYVFRHLHPLYMCGVSVPIVAFLAVTIMLYRKTMSHMKTLAAVGERRQPSQIESQIVALPDLNESCRADNSTRLDSVITLCSQNGEDGPQDTRANTRRESNGLPGTERNNGREQQAVQRLTWYAHAQKNVRMILIQVTIYGTSLIAGMIAASLGLNNVRAIINAVTLICILISPYQYVSKIPEVKTAMLRAFRCHPNTVTPET